MSNNARRKKRRRRGARRRTIRLQFFGDLDALKVFEEMLDPFNRANVRALCKALGVPAHMLTIRSDSEPW